MLRMSLADQLLNIMLGLKALTVNVDIVFVILIVNIFFQTLYWTRLQRRWNGNKITLFLKVNEDFISRLIQRHEHL